MAKSANTNTNTNTVPKLYRCVIEDGISDVRDIFLDDRVHEQVLMALKTLWENKVMQSRAVDGFHSEQQLLLQVQQQHQQHHHHHRHHHHQQAQPQQMVPEQAQTQQVPIPASQQATAPQVIVANSKLVQHMNASSIKSAAATATTLALPAGVTPVTDTNKFRPAASGGQSSQGCPVYLSTSAVSCCTTSYTTNAACCPAGPSPTSWRDLTTDTCHHPATASLTGNKTQVIPTTVAAPTPAAQPAQHLAPLVLQVDGTGDTSSEEDEDEEEDYDDHEEEEKEKDGAEDGQVEEESPNSADALSDEEGQEL